MSPNLWFSAAHFSSTAMDCSICLKPLTDHIQVRTDCKHTFHLACLEEWVPKGEGTCPLCRSPVRLEHKRRMHRERQRNRWVYAQDIADLTPMAYGTGKDCCFCLDALCGWGKLSESVVEGLCGHRAHDICLGEWFASVHAKTIPGTKAPHPSCKTCPVCPGSPLFVPLRRKRVKWSLA